MKAATIFYSSVLFHFAEFQSTPPVKAATLDGLTFAELSEISIHAAREGGDRLVLLPEVLFAEFQSTPPVKAATR